MTDELKEKEVVDDAPTEELDDMRGDFDAVISDAEESAAIDGLPAPEEGFNDDPITDKALTDDAPASKKAPEGQNSDAEKAAPAALDDAPEGKVAAKTEKAPVGWKADAREQWDKIPDVARQAIATREREVAVLMQNTAQERRTARQFSDTLMPHRATLEQMGYNDPFAAVQGVMGAAVAMRTGTMAERAAATAQVLVDFGIDINALDTAIVNRGGGGGVAQSAAPNDALEQMLNKRMQPMDELLTTINQQKASQLEQGRVNAQAEVTDFTATAEFIGDVRMDMADLLDLAAKRGQPLTMQDAYDKACLMHPTVSKVMQARQAQEASQGRTAQMQGKRAAASSVSGSPAGRGSAKALESIEDELNNAWDQHASQRV